MLVAASDSWPVLGDVECMGLTDRLGTKFCWRVCAEEWSLDNGIRGVSWGVGELEVYVLLGPGGG